MKIFTKLKKLNNNNNGPAHPISIYIYKTYIQKQSTDIINNQSTSFQQCIFRTIYTK